MRVMPSSTTLNQPQEVFVPRAMQPIRVEATRAAKRSLIAYALGFAVLGEARNLNPSGAGGASSTILNQFEEVFVPGALQAIRVEATRVAKRLLVITLTLRFAPLAEARNVAP